MLPRALVNALDVPPAAGPSLVGPAGPGHLTLDGDDLVNMASCNYLGLARHPSVLAAAHQALEQWGLGTAATRTLSGSTTLHRDLEQRLGAWVGTADAVLFSSCWTANAAVFAALSALAARSGNALGVFSDRHNHASIIDGIKAQRDKRSQLFRYDRENLDELGRQLAATPPDTIKVIVTDGVFSMEGDQAPLPALLALADRWDALLVVDDSHGVGVVGATGRGCAEAQDVLGQVDVLVGTLGKALGGAVGGFAATTNELAAWMRASSRPFIFSNNPPVSVVAGALAALEVLSTSSEPLDTLRGRTRRLRDGIAALGLPTVAGEHPIVPVIIGAEEAAVEASALLRRHGVFATALAYPIVPRGQARLRLQVSAAHTVEDIDLALTGLEGVR